MLSDKFLRRISSLLLLIVPIRGLLVILIGSKTATTIIYAITLLITFIICCLGIYISLKPRLSVILSKRLRQYLLFNIIFNIIWLLPILFTNLDIGVLMDPIYLSFFPFLIYVYTFIDPKTIPLIFFIISIVVSVGILWDFVEMNILIDRFEIAISRQELLRPNEFKNIGRNGELYRPNGITGSRPHDASNILAMLLTFWTTKYLISDNKYNFLKLPLILIIFISLIATQVISNIISFIFIQFIILIFLFYIQPKNLVKKVLLLLSPVLLVVILYPSLLIVVDNSFNRVGESGDWKGMFLAFSNSDFYSYFLTFFIGHSGSLNFSHSASILEFAILRMLFEYGILHYILILVILFYPIKFEILKKLRTSIIHLPFFAVILVGIVSLWHYGSVWRITNSLIFWLCYSQIILLNEERI